MSPLGDNYRPAGESHSFIDRTGLRVGHLTVLSYVGTNKAGSRVWECQCDCGRKKNIGYSRLRSGKIVSCGCRKFREYVPSNRMPAGEASFNALFSSYKHGAKRRGHTFELDREYFRELTQSNCYYCNREPSQEGPTNRQCNGFYLYTGIDRIDNTKGYIPNNVRPCCKQCNRAKDILTETEFFEWIQHLSSNLRSRGAI